MSTSGPDTILLDLFRTNQVRERLIVAALEGLELPPEDYPMYVMVGAEGPLDADRFRRARGDAALDRPLPCRAP